MRTWHTFRRLFLAPLLFAAVGLAAPGYAAQPKVSFDLGYVVECHDVTPQAFALLHPDEKVIEANVRVSVRLESGEEKDIEQLQFEFTSPAERLKIIDFLPRTQIEPEADNIEVVKTSETVHTVGGAVGATVAISGGGKNGSAAVTSALPSGNANSTHRNQLTETTKKIPTGRPIVTSGTLENEHGVFFKLRRTAAGSFEGIKLFSFRFAVPSNWRGDWLVVSCQARGTVSRYFFKSVEEIGTSKAFLAMHLAGDTTAEKAAQEMAQAQEEYFAAKPPKDRFDLIISTLATEARPWRDQAHTHHVSASVKTPVTTCLKPVTTTSVFRFCTKGKTSSCEACNLLKHSLDRVACFSAAPGWHVDEAATSDE